MKENTRKTYEQKCNEVIDYINTNLQNSIDLNIIANRMNVSRRQLLRIMSNYINEPLYSYIRRLRLERAITYMQIEKLNLTELANKVGYENSQSFSKAFRKQFDVSPKIYLQKLHSRLKNYTTYEKTRKNNINVEETCLEKDLHLIYIQIFGKYGEVEPYLTGWKKLNDFLIQHKYKNEATRYIGISLDDPNITKSENCRFYACASVCSDNIVQQKNEFGTVSIPRGRYAIYTLEGSYSQLQNIYNNIYLDSKYKIRYGVVFEEYINSPNDVEEKDLITKIYIPIQ